MNYDASREKALALVASLAPILPQDPNAAFTALSAAIATMPKAQKEAVLAFFVLQAIGQRQTSSMEQLCGEPR